MTNLELMYLLAELPADATVKVDAVFNAAGGSPLRSVVENNGEIHFRDYFMQHNGDLVFKVADEEYVVVR